MRNTAISSRGFTLAEVTIAMLVLSSAMIVMISLQSASVDNAFRDERRQKALLAARSVFSAIEMSEDPIQDIDVTAPLTDLLSQREPLNGLSDWADHKDLQPFTGHLVIKDWPLPLKDVPPDALKVMTLTVSWSPSSADSMALTFFVPKRIP